MAKTLNDDGCEYGRMLRKDMDFLGKKIDEGFGSVFLKLKKFDDNQNILFNHQSTRIPQEVATRMNRLYALLGSIAGGVAIAVIALIFGRII